MFEKIFGKKTEKPINIKIIDNISAEELVDKISDKVSKNIESDVRDYVKELKKNENSQKEVIEALDKRKKELEIEALNRDINNKAQHHKINRTSQNLWYSLTSWSRIKVEENDFKNILLNHKEASSPQAIQGKWQAYGQMRAARTTMRGTIISTGVLGVGLFFYQKLLSRQEEELNEKEKRFSKSTEAGLELSATANMLGKQLELADLKVKALCKGDVKCYSDYESQKAKAQEEAKETFEEVKKTLEKNGFNFLK